MSDRQLDVRPELPALTHEMIPSTCIPLAPDNGLLLEPDPKPLYRQFDAKGIGQFAWDFVEQGADVWEVHIGRANA